jgi:uncharacterized protein (TIGR03437 family)
MRLFTIFLLADAAFFTLAGAASITGVYNAGNWIPPSLPSSGISRGAIFTVTGSGLGPGALTQVQNYPLPTSAGLSGTTVQVKVGTVTEACIMVYTVSSQVAAILPSSTPVGSGMVTVSYQGSSASFAIEVVAGTFGMFTLNEGGSGPGVVTDLSYNAISMINPAHPGENLILWGTGLGAVTGDETEPPTPVNFPGVQVLIQNQAAVVTYAGRSSSPGLDQINVTVPAGITGGCKASVAVVVNGVVGNVTTTAIAPAGQATCGDNYGALTTTNLAKAAASGSLSLGAVDLVRVGGAGDDIFQANFSTYPMNSLIRSYGGSPGPSLGGCTAYEVTGGSSFSIADPIFNLGSLAPTPLNAGSSMVLSPQGGAPVTIGASSTGVYALTLAAGGADYIKPGTYTVTNGNGGSQVPAFSWTDTLPAPISFVGLPTVVNRAKDLTLSWTNSSAFGLVTIFAYSGVPLNSTTNSFVDIVCSAPATSGQFTIPAAILGLLPANGYATTGVPGVVFEIGGIVINRFSATGIDTGVFSTYTSGGAFVSVQ